MDSSQQSAAAARHAAADPDHPDSFAARYPGLATAADLIAETGQSVTWTGYFYVIGDQVFTDPDAVRTYAASWPA